ncbi:hypothetical protein IWW50_003408 [Coemansia erecta]|nr:hypothetical protein GGF43_001146 [Coemansia sp. RSA 2618]KAJ2824282.1 hypothetical protein IWW50_003408 [Coemansia erecta]
MRDNTRQLTRGTRALAMKRKARQQEVEEVSFDAKARQTFLTGFHKRKVERREKAASEIRTQDRKDMLQMRKERREQQRDQLAEKLLGDHEFGKDSSDDDDNSGSSDNDDDDDGKGKGTGDVEVLQGAGTVTTVTVTRGFEVDELGDQEVDLDRRLTPQEVALALKRDLQRRMERAQSGTSSDGEDGNDKDGGGGGDEKDGKKNKKQNTKKKGVKKFRYETKAKRAATNAKSRAAKSRGKPGGGSRDRGSSGRSKTGKGK